MLYVGLGGPSGWVAQMNPDHLEGAESARFRVYRAGETKQRKREYILDVRPVEEVFSGGTVSSQAELLARWANGQFRTLADVLAP